MGQFYSDIQLKDHIKSIVSYIPSSILLMSMFLIGIEHLLNLFALLILCDEKCFEHKTELGFGSQSMFSVN